MLFSQHLFCLLFGICPCGLSRAYYPPWNSSSGHPPQSSPINSQDLEFMSIHFSHDLTELYSKCQLYIINCSLEDSQILILTYWFLTLLWGERRHNHSLTNDNDRYVNIWKKQIWGDHIFHILIHIYVFNLTDINKPRSKQVKM